MSVNCNNGKVPGFVRWRVGYPNGATVGEMYITGLQITGPDGATYIADGDFAGGHHISGYSAYISAEASISIVAIDGWALPTASPTGLPTATWPPSVSTVPTAVPVPAPSAAPVLHPSPAPSETSNPSPVPTLQRPANFVALSAVYTATNGPGWTQKKNWMNGTDPCQASWENVQCDSSTSTKIIVLDLQSNNLIGTIPTEIGLLTEMRRTFRLASNRLTGTLPTEIGLLTACTQSLNLQKSSLTGTLPSEIGSLTRFLWTLNLWGNSFSGLIPRYRGSSARLVSS